jgi:hypothetical protein
MRQIGISVDKKRVGPEPTLKDRLFFLAKGHGVYRKSDQRVSAQPHDNQNSFIISRESEKLCQMRNTKHDESETDVERGGTLGFLFGHQAKDKDDDTKNQINHVNRIPCELHRAPPLYDGLGRRRLPPPFFTLEDIAGAVNG